MTYGDDTHLKILNFSNKYKTFFANERLLYFDFILAKIIKILDTKDQGIAEDTRIPGGANV